MQRHGPWTITHSHPIYQDPWIRVVRDDVIRPDGLPGTYSTVQLKAGVTAIALDDAEHVLLTREFHYAVGRVTLEGASGGIESDESAEQAAARELLEELGIRAGRWTDLGTVDPFTAAILSPTRMFLARDLDFQPPQLEGTEQIECVRMPLSEAIQLVLDSQITHGATCVALLKIQHLLRAGIL
jgi:ADP-ribose pyrophosphatase